MEVTVLRARTVALHPLPQEQALAVARELERVSWRWTLHLGELLVCHKNLREKNKAAMSY